MLLEFSVGNFRSFKEPVTFSMVASGLTAKMKELDDKNVFSLDDKNATRLLKSAAIYGSNASGKSNLIAAMRFVNKFVVDSSKESQADEPIPLEPFRLSTETDRKPSYFELVFYSDGTRYRYGFEADSRRIHSEWLYHVPNVRESQIFYREGQKFEMSSVFREGRGLEQKTRDNALFISVAAQFNGSKSRRVLSWFKNFNVISGIHDAGYRGFTSTSLADEEMRDEIISFVRELDLGIEDIRVEKSEVTEDDIPKEMPEEIIAFLVRQGSEQNRVTTRHRKFDKNGKKIDSVIFSLDSNESDGTRKLFALSGPILDTLKNGKILIVDELDTRLHPLITSTIVRLFNSSDANSNNAQLVFATHDTNILSNTIFRRDQIWFTEKDRFGASDLYSLAEYRIRNDASFEKDYIAGKYGAIPFIGGLRRLAGSVHA